MAKDPQPDETKVSINGIPVGTLDEFSEKTAEVIDAMATGTAQQQQLSFKVYKNGRPPNRNGDGPERVEGATVGISGKLVNGFGGEAMNGCRELYMDEPVEIRVIAEDGQVLASAFGGVDGVAVKRQNVEGGRSILVREQKVKV